jgi:threonine/homoserine/homoserine lactone efflux protein
VELLAAAALGLGLGVVTGLPLGVVNVAIVEAALAGRRGFAIGLGLGGALADGVHAALAFAGTGQLVTAHPAAMRVLAVVAAALICGYAVAVWRGRAPGTGGRHTPHEHGHALGPGHGRVPLPAITTGAMLTLPNPGALAAWVAVAAAAWPDASLVEASVLAAGVGTGSAAWFTVLARLAGKLPRDHAVVRVVPRLAVLALVAIAIAGLARAL